MAGEAAALQSVSSLQWNDREEGTGAVPAVLVRVRVR